MLHVIKDLTKRDPLLQRACCLYPFIPLSYAWLFCLANVFLQELQGPGYSSASASGKLRRMVPLSHLRSAVVPPSWNSASCAPPVSTGLKMGNCTGNGDIPKMKNNVECLNGRASHLVVSKREFLTPKTKSFSVASRTLWPSDFLFFRLQTTCKNQPDNKKIDRL